MAARALALVLFVVVASGCRLVTREVACRRDRDCPQDVGLGFCDAAGDGGAGLCVAEDPDPAVDSGPDDDDGGSDAG